MGLTILGLNRNWITKNTIGTQVQIVPHLWWFKRLTGSLVLNKNYGSTWEQHYVYCFLCRTIITGICYLATFVFGINSAGLMLYALQLALGSIFDSDTNSNKPTSKTDGDQLNTVSPSEGSANNVVSTNSDLKQNSDNSTNSSQ